MTGRPPHKPTDETREKVKALVIGGIDRDGVARVLGISDRTLVKHYRDELETADIQAVADCALTLHQKAIKGDTASLIFFLKTRGKKYGWTERQEFSGPDGGAIPVEAIRRVIVDPKTDAGDRNA